MGDVVDVKNSDLSAWLDQQRAMAKGGRIDFRIVVDEQGVAMLETSKMVATRRKGVRVLTGHDAVSMAIREAKTGK